MNEPTSEASAERDPVVIAELWRASAHHVANKTENETALRLYMDFLVDSAV